MKSAWFWLQNRDTQDRREALEVNIFINEDLKYD
jgi:hypothetical protein